MTPTPAQLAARVAELEQECERLRPLAKRWLYVAAHWSNAQIHWNRDQSLKSLVLTIKAAHVAAHAKEIEREIDAALSAHGADGPKE